MSKGKKVLIIDDDADILEAVKLALESVDLVTNTTTKAEETYKRIDLFKPDVLVLDVLLSGIDGRTICKKLKSSEHTKNIPIVMISAHPGAAQSTIASGANAFLAKPFDIFELIKKVESFFKKD